MIINEWQLDVKLNGALQNAQRADFALYLALLSPAVEESAEFFTPEPVTEQIHRSLYQQLGVMPARSFGLVEGDSVNMQLHNEALQQSGLVQLKLASYLNPPPLSQYDDKQRIAADVWQNLSLHSRRRLLQTTPDKPDANPVGLYDVLQQLHGLSAA